MKKNIAKLYNELAIVFPVLINEIKKYVKEGNIVIDLGCGTGVYINLLKNQVGMNGKVICIDKNSQMVKFCRKKFSKSGVIIKQLSAEKLSSINEKVDVVFSSLVLHFTNKRKSIIEIKRVLKENGKLIFAVPLYRRGIEIAYDKESRKFQAEFLENIKYELRKYSIQIEPSLDYANKREENFKKLLQKNGFKIMDWKNLSLEKEGLIPLLDYFKISWRSEKLLKVPFPVRYKILSTALKKTFHKYPYFIVNRYYLIAVAMKNKN